MARGLFPKGIQIVDPGEVGQEATERNIAAGTPILFQPIFERAGFLAAVDVLEYSDKVPGYTIHEIKSSTKPNDEHLYDVAFQAVLLRQCGFAIHRIVILHLNPHYVRLGELDQRKLFALTDMTSEVNAIEQIVADEMQQAQKYLMNGSEPPGACSCIYKGRSRHCSTFHYSNPDVPGYSVHDISRIGSSPKKLKELVDAGIFTLDRIPKHIQLSAIKQAQINAYSSAQIVIRRGAIAGELGKLEFPLHFIDYETYPSAIPLFDHYSAYQHIPFQYSLHVSRSAVDKPIHKEFLYVSSGDPSATFLASLRENINSSGSIIVWNKSFEAGINEKIADRIPEAREFMANFNERIYDLKDIFSKQYYIHQNLWGKTSIKSVLPVLAPELSYSTLDIREGGAASILAQDNFRGPQ